MSLKRIVIAHNFLGPHGGAEQSTYKTYQLLTKTGYEVFMFGTNMAPLFEDFSYSHLFPKYTNYDDLKTPFQKVKSVLKPFYNFNAERQFKEFLKQTQPDIVHFGSIHWHLSPAVIQPCLDLNIPTVMTLRESRFICPAGTLLKGNGEYCKEVSCLKHGAWQAVKNKCYEKSLAKSLIVASEFSFRKLHQLFYKIDQFICPSQALADLVQEAGIESKRITIIPNFVDDSWLTESLLSTPGEYFFYAGRLSKEKGVDIFLQALALINPAYPVIIAGSGPEQETLEKLSHELGLSQIKFMGAIPSNELMTLYKNALATILPCNWFENFPRSVLESLSMGTPVIASDIGGIPEMVIHHETGLLVEPGNIDALASALSYSIKNPQKLKQLGIQGHETVKACFNENEYLKNTINTYEKILQN
jgi:glycosyltransferase involved in cell wall biosynthesis